MCIAPNVAKPGNTFVYDTAAAIVTALRSLRGRQQRGERKTSTILQLRPIEQNPRVPRPGALVCTPLRVQQCQQGIRALCRSRKIRTRVARPAPSRGMTVCVLTARGS
ncbi:hypothetical protein BAUCODRAFT_485274 [Baudoinia panamericana UAMH 10762]|uniref:Uncharacterized protein n=1 Tax=Baudoinia panamericana (strain UAMH 10762) TaxID=717646 RepID=M2MYK2_BAUPA|nr:uncharacterized protein BAUCODRAFT_485274 [Baudoinia panamericana UAMH 10762]EMC96678.1 hypothetical protein BAUCODRAFT_485274 [Baudoinia panamericana UAMH 10762]